MRQPSGEAYSAAGCGELQLPAVLNANRSGVQRSALTTYAANRNLMSLRGGSMKRSLQHLVIVISIVGLALALAPTSIAQQSNSVVPTLVNFSGTLTDANGMPLAGTVGVTFYLYKDQQGGSPLWIETQNVQPDRSGHFSVMLGSTKSEGLPTNLFASGEARWLGVQAEGQAEQPRVMLLAVPYALKAGDAATVGGLPPSAFMLAAPTNAGSSSTAEPAGNPTSSANPSVGGSGAQNYIPIWTDNSGDLGNSVLYQVGTGSSAKIGLNIKSPLASLDIVGTELVRGLFETATQGVATASQGYNSNPIDQEASAYNSSSKKAVMQHFEWQAEPTGNNTNNPGATLNLLFGTGNNKPAETGLKLSNTGVFTFAAGQAFPGTGTITGITTASGSGLMGGGSSGNLSLGLVNTCTANQILQWNGTMWACSSAGTGTITGVTAGTALTGGGSSGNVTLNLDTTKVPLLAASNTFTAGQTINSGGAMPSLSVNSTASAAAISVTAAAGAVFAETTSAAVNGAVDGLDASSSGRGTGVYGYSPSGMGVSGISPNNIGVSGTTTSGLGVSGTSNAAGVGVYGNSTNGTGVFGTTTSGIGVSGVSSGNNAVQGIAHTANGSGVAGFNTVQDATGVYGSNQNGYGFVTDSHVSQGRSMGGWVKAMAYAWPGGIIRCFNSQLPGSQASTPPCGMTFFYLGPGNYLIDFGFQVDDRFVTATPSNTSSAQACFDDTCSVDSNQVEFFFNGTETFFSVAVY